MAIPVSKVLDATQAEAQADDETRNPDVNPGANGSQVIHITLVAQGVPVDAGDIYDMLNTQFETVTVPKNTLGRNDYIFNVSA